MWLFLVYACRAVFTWLLKGIGFGFGFGFTMPFGWLVYLLWFWFYDSQVKTALFFKQLSQPAFLDKVDQRASSLAWNRSAKSTKQRIQHSVKPR